MRYEDASQSGSSSGENPIARDDTDALPAGDRGPATGNVISGSGTQTGQAGADLHAETAHVVSIGGNSGSDSTFAGGKLVADGQFGRISIDREGNYSYLANKGAPESSRDTFTYKLADARGQADSATLTIEIGKTPAVIQANAQRVVPGPDGVVVLPAGVELSDIQVVGRNLVINLPDGRQMVIVDGAVFVPQLVLGDVEVPATSLAALLIGSELRPAAGDEGGQPLSGGGNFEVPVGPLDPGIDLGDLIPPTELTYIPPDFREVAIDEDDEPEILIQTPDQPAGAVDASARVFEEALAARPGEPAGSNSSSTAETTTGTIVFESEDTPNTITINGTAVIAVGQVIAGTYGALTITSIGEGTIGYSYTLADNTSGDTTSDIFTVVITDRDGDTDTATLTVSIVDDVPTARADVDSVREDGPLVANGNVLTGVGGNDANTTDGVADTPGADGITVTGIAFGSTAGSVGSAVAGAYGSLVLGANGAYVYTLNNQSGAVQALGVNESLTEIFTYTITDGDGDVRSTTLTITINGANDAPTIVAAAATVSEEGLAAGNPDATGLPTDTTNSATATGQLTIADVDGDAMTVTLGTPAGSLTSHGQPITWSLSSDGHVLTGSAGGTAVITVSVANSGAYTVTLLGQVDHPNAGGEDVLSIGVPVSLSDGTVTVSSTLTVSVEDDSPRVAAAPTVTSSVLIDETAGASPLSSGAPIVVTSSGAIITAGVSFGADGPGTATTYGLSLQGGTSVASGLQTALGDQPITLTATSATLITGTYNGGTQTAFTIQINADGSVTVTQFTALEHAVDGSDAAAFDDALSLVLGGVSLVNATATYTDFDGDQVTATTGIGGAITFRDDGPAIDVTANAQTEAGVLLTTGDDGTESAGSTSASTATGNFGGTFGLTFDVGADGAATPSLAFALSATTSVSGLTSNGVAINLYNVGGVIVGSTAATAPASVTDASVVFAVSVSASGIVTLTQYAQIDHPLEAGANNAPFADQLASLADGAITLTASSTIVDNDGDSASDSATINIGANLRFADDGPDIAATLVQGATIRIDETDGVAAAGGEIDPVGGSLGTVTVAAASLFTVSTVSPSADAPTTLSYALSISAPGVASGLLLSTTNEAIVLVDNNGVIEGRVGTTTGAIAFTVSIDAATGATTLTQFLAVEHGDTTSYDEDSSGLTAGVLSVAVTATDYDGDTDVASADLGSIIRFEDDGPLGVNDSATQLTEDANVTIDVFANDVRGADGAVSSSVQLVAGSQVGGGTLTNNGNGTFTLDPAPGQTGTVTFNYTFVDGDGDVAQATATITLLGDSAPTLAPATNLTVDEDGFANANVDAVPLQVNPAEVDSTESRTATGSVVASFGNDVPANLLGSIALVDTAALDGQLTLLNGAPVTFALGTGADAGVLIGSSGGTEVIRITITGAVAGPGAGQVTYSYSTLLSQPIEHVAGGGENNALLNGVTLQVTDADGDITTGTFNVTVVDDVPTALNDSATQTTEDANVTIDVFANDVRGADGAVSSSVQLVAGSQVGGGTLTNNGNGTFTLDPAPGQTGTVTFNYTFVDGDGDVAQATATITLLGDSAPTLAPATNLTVDEDGFGNANVDAVPLQVNPAEVDSTESRTATGSVVASFGNDVPANLLGSIALVDTAALDGQLTLLNGAPVTFALGTGADAGVLIGSSGGTEVIRITITGAVAGPGAGQVTYSYSTLLSQPIEHVAGGGENNALLNGVTLQVTDADGDITTGTFNVTVVDDVPTALNDSATQLTEDANVTIDVFANDVRGADGAVSSSVQLVAGSQVGGGTLTNNGNGTFTLDPAPGQTGTVTFNYTFVDGDGDVAQATATITLLGDSAPTLAPATNLTVDEDGFANANVDAVPLQVNPAEVDSTESRTATGSVVASFGNDVPANLLGSIALVDTAALDGQLTLLNGAPVTFALGTGADAGVLIGSSGGTEVIRITITGAVAGPGAGQVTYSYSTLLSQPIEHVAGGGENNALLNGVTLQVTDADGDITTGTFNVTVVDDVPTALNDSATQLTEDANVTIDVFANDVRGADGAVASSVQLVAGSQVGGGTLTNNGNGTFTLDPAPGQTGTVTFNYTFVDGDGDVAQATATITLLGDSAPTLAPATNLTVDEDGFANANVDAVPLQVNPAEVDSTESRTATGSVVASFGNDVPANLLTSIALVDTAALDGQLTLLNGAPVTFALGTGADAGVLIGSSGGTEVIRITITGAVAGPGAGQVTYSYSTLLSQPIEHVAGGGENNALLNGVTLQVTDADGDITTGTFNVTVVDDVPTALNDSATQLTEDANVTIDVFANDVRGADGAVASSVQLVAGSQVGGGTLTNNGNGTFTLDPAPGQTGTVTFNYTFVDGDGDVAQATATITLLGDSAPTLAPATNLTVDEDGFANANVDAVPLQVSPAEVDSTESRTATGSVVASFGNDVPANLLASIALVDTAALDGQLTLLNGAPVTFALGTGADAGVLIGSSGGTEVIRITITGAVAGPGAGQVTYSYSTLLSQPLEHVAGGGENNALLNGVTLQVTDADGDITTGTFNVTVVDDVPTAAVNGAVPRDTLVLDETRPLGTETDGDSNPAGLDTVTANFADNFASPAVFGADGGTIAFSLVLNGSNVGSGLYALDTADQTAGDGDGIGRGAQILLNQSGNVIIGSVGATEYFRITIDASGNVTFQQSLNVWHSDTSSDDDTSTLTALANSLVVRQTVTDGDGDVSTADIDLSTGVFQIEDDGPNAFTTNAVVTTNGNTPPVHGTFNGFDIGTDGFGRLTFDPGLDGDPATDNGGRSLFVGTQQLFYHVTGNVLTASTSGGTVGFTVTLNQNGSYDFDVNAAISNGTQTSFSNLTSTSAGNVLYRGVGTDNPATPIDVLLSATSGGAPATVNTDSDSVGSANNSVGAGDSVRIDFVSLLTSGAGNTTGFNYTDHVGGTTFTQFIPQVQGNQTQVVSFTVFALDTTLTPAGAPDSNPAGGFSDSTGVNITSVRVTDYDTGATSAAFNVSALPIDTPTLVAFGIFVERNADGSVTFSGVQEGDSYSISTGSNFDAVVVQQVSGGFDLGIFTLGGGASGTPIVQSFGIVAIDADGDAQTSTITTTINPAGAAPAAMAIALDKSVDSAPTSSVTSLSQDTQELRSYSAANSNLVLASALAAVGLATTPVAAHVDDHQVDSLQSSAMPMGGLADAATVSFDRAPADSAHGLDAQVVTADAAMTGRLGDFTSSHDAQLAPEAHLDLQDLSALVAPSDLPVDLGATAAAGMGADIVIPSTEALESMAAASDIANAQRGLTVDRVIAEALDGGAGGDMVDAALAALTEHGGGGNSALLALASHDGTGVSAWDMGPAGHLSADLITNIVMDVSTFHHDAVQPAING